MNYTVQTEHLLDQFQWQDIRCIHNRCFCFFAFLGIEFVYENTNGIDIYNMKKMIERKFNNPQVPTII